MGEKDLEKGLDDSSDPARLSTSSGAEEHTRPQSPQHTPDSNAVADGDPSIPYGPQSIIVDWDGPDDPEHPQNWPYKKKWIITMVFATPTLCVTFASSIFSAAAAPTAELFNTSPEVMVLATSLFVLGFGTGPTIWGPLSELYGRKVPLTIGFTVFTIFQIPVAVAQDLQSVLVFRFLQGFFGSSPVSVIGGAFADFWNQRERGFSMPIFSAALFVGPIFGPIVGTLVSNAEHLGWRWTQWITLILACFFGLLTLIVVPETYAPVLLSRRAKRLRHETGNWALHAAHEERKVNLHEIADKYLSRPARMFVQEPILALVTIYMGFVYGLIYLFFFSYPITFQVERGLKPAVASCAFLGIFAGVLCGCALVSGTIDTKLAPDYAKGRYQETRLILMSAGGIALPIGMFWSAWTSFPSLSPWPQAIAGIPIGFGTMTITLQGFNYLLDCYSVNANSALAANTLVRSWFGAGFPLFAKYMYDALGVQWATSVLGFIAIALVPVPMVYYKYGAKIRAMSKYVPR